MISEADLELIEQYLDDRLDEAGLKRLSIALQSPACRRELEWAMQLRGLVGLAESDTSDSEFSASVLDRCAGLQTASLENKVLKNLQQRAQKSALPKTSAPFWKRSVFIVAVAAQVVVGLVLWTVFAKPEAVLIARLSSATADGFLLRNQDKLRLQPGLEIRAGDLLQLGRQGSCELDYSDGTHMRLEPDSSASFNQESGAKRLQLYTGNLFLDVVPQSQGKEFEIKTEHASCIVRGTKLCLKASPLFTRLSVEHGAVEMVSLHQPGKIQVKAGESASTSANAAAKINIKTDPLFASSLISKGSTPISVPLNGGKKIYLVVDTGGDSGNCDHSVWINPRFRGHGKADLSLTQRPWLQAKSSWSGPRPHINTGLFDEAAKVQGQEVKPCISVHPSSVIVYDVPPGYTSFEAEGGVLDSGFSPPNYFPSVRFYVYTEMAPELLQELLK